MALRILFLADTHLGIDLPARPRVERPRRGDDFFEAFERALAPAANGEADLVIHGGDLFYRSRIPAWLAERVFTRLADLADTGVPFFWVPGNHERSGIPRALLLTHPGIHVFDRPRTFVVKREGFTLALAGFPFSPRIRDEFPALLAATGHAEGEAALADARLLCVHQAVEGAKVGPQNFTFRGGDDVLPGRAIPAGFSAVLSGHIHRHQVLERDLAGRPLASPVLYPGSIDRTSFAEKGEPKGTLLLTVARTPEGRVTTSWEFRELPTRPMLDLRIDPADTGPPLNERLREALARLPAASIVRIRLASEPSAAALPHLTAAALRAVAPAGMHVSVAWGRRP